MRNILRTGLYFLYICLIIFFSLEILVRVWGYADMYFYDPIYMPFNKSQEIPYVMKPNLNHVQAHGNIWINTDALGLRSPVPGRTYGNKQANEYRIAFVGNSVTFGVGVPAGETYPEIVEQTLNHLQHHCHVTVFNFGVSSYSIKEMTATLKYRVPEVNPDLVVMGLVIDDFDTNRTPQVDKWGYNTHGQASQLINKYPTLKLVLRKIHLSYLIRDILSRTMMRQEINYEPAGGKLPPIVSNSYKYINSFKKLAQEYGYSYLVLTLPSAEGNGSEFIPVIKNMIHDQINYYNVSSLTPQFTYNEFHASKYDWHPSGLVHKKVGIMLSDFILNHFLEKACNNKPSPLSKQ
ncbi:MAG: SGNH/GDSL hydrolase family protein [Desulfobaccales bacterium]